MRIVVRKDADTNKRGNVVAFIVMERYRRLRLDDGREVYRRLYAPFPQPGTKSRDRAIIGHLIAQWGDVVYGVTAEALASIYADAVRSLVPGAECQTYVQRAEVIVEALEFRGSHKNSPGDPWVIDFLDSVRRMLG